MSSTYSVLIRTWNSDATLGKTLRSLRIQDLPPEGILIIDSGSTDGTLKTAAEFKARIIHYPSDLPFNYSKALNIGLAAAETDYVLIISSHTVIPYKNIARWLTTALQDPNVVGAYCVTKWLLDPRQNCSRSPNAIK